MNHRKLSHWLLAASAPVAATFTHLAHADTCTLPDPSTAYNNPGGLPSLTDNMAYFSDGLLINSACTIDPILSNTQTPAVIYHDQLGFTSDWSNGWGAPNGYCDVNTPLARTLGAFEALRNSMTPTATSWSDR